MRLLFDFFPPQGPPFNCFVFCNGMVVEESQRVLPFQFFSALWDFSKTIFHKRFPIHQYFDTLKSFCYFLSLRYGADLGRSRLVFACTDIWLISGMPDNSGRNSQVTGRFPEAVPEKAAKRGLRCRWLRRWRLWIWGWIQPRSSGHSRGMRAAPSWFCSQMSPPCSALRTHTWPSQEAPG